MKWEVILKCACGAYRGVMLDEEEFQNYIESQEDGLKVVCGNCACRYKRDYLDKLKEDKKKEVANG